MSDWTAGDYGGAFAGAVAALAAIGKGLAWLLNWQGAREDRRAAKLQSWEDSLTQRERAHRLELEGKFKAIEARTGALAIALFDVTLELKTHAPASPAVRRALGVLRSAFPIEEITPPAMVDLMDRLDAMDGSDGD